MSYPQADEDSGLCDPSQPNHPRDMAQTREPLTLGECIDELRELLEEQRSEREG